LDQLEQTGLLARRRHHVQHPGAVPQQHARGVGAQDQHTALGQLGEQLDDVEVVDQRVGEQHERLRQIRFSQSHVTPPK
jgi:hypothetical protein